MAQCWICGASADSREHRFKKSDLARAGKTWSREDQPFFVNSDGIRRLQGPGSKLVTFSKVICQQCNNAGTQAYDRAYETFSNWAEAQGAALLKRNELDFREIFGADFEYASLNLLYYFIKLLGCRVLDSGNPLPDNLAAAFSRKHVAPFALSFALNETSFGGIPARGSGILGNYPIIGTYRRSTDAVLPQYVSGSIVGYVDVIYRYAYAARYPWEGNEISGPVRRVNLGQYDPKSGDPHLANGQPPMPRRIFRIGDEDVEVPLLSVEQLRAISSMKLPDKGMSVAENLDARIKIISAVLASAYPHITTEYLKNHLTIATSDAIWNSLFAPQ